MPQNDTQEIKYRDPIKQVGFATVEHVLTLDATLSDGAYRTYALLKYFWMQKDTAFPTVDTLADMRGVRRETISGHLKELVEKGLISRERRFGTSTLTHLEDLPQEYQDMAREILADRHVKKIARQSLEKPNVSREENLTQRITIEEEPIKNSLSKGEPPKSERQEALETMQTAFEKCGGYLNPTMIQRFYAAYDANSDNRPARLEYAVLKLQTDRNFFRAVDAYMQWKPPTPPPEYAERRERITRQPQRYSNLPVRTD